MNQAIGVPSLPRVQPTAAGRVSEASTGFLDKNYAGGEVPRAASVTDGQLEPPGGYLQDAVHRRFHEICFGLQKIATAACISGLRPESNSALTEVPRLADS